MVTARHPSRPTSAVALTERQAEIQHQRGLYTVQRGEPIPIPVDHLKRPTVFLNREMWRQDEQGRVFRPGTRFQAPAMEWQARALAWARDHVHPDIPAMYYRVVLGHDQHISTWGELSARHFHAGWANPFNPEKVDRPIAQYYEHDCDKPFCALRGGGRLVVPGFIEDCGWLSSNKVTTAFRDLEAGYLVTDSTEYGDFKYHEVGTDNTAEANSQTALIATTGIARATGTQTNPTASTYRSVGTITADTTETWQEHGLFNHSTSVTLMDRSLTGGQSVNNLDQVEYTYTLTKNAEA